MRPTDPPVTFDRLRDLLATSPSASVPSSPDRDPPQTPADGSPHEPLVPPGSSSHPVPRLRLLILIGSLAALAAAGFLWWSRPAPEPVPKAVVRPAVHSAPPAASPGPSSSGGGTVVVDVAGKVRRPGVVTLPAGARVIDAINRAGGIRPGASPGHLNLARRVTDGEQVLVGVRGTPAPATPPPSAGGIPGAPSPDVSGPGAKVDLNTATASQLDQLPGVGPVLAQRIVDYRTQHGAFRTVDELRQVSGIGPAKFNDLKGLVRV